MDLEKIIESFDKAEKAVEYSAKDVGDEKIVFITTCQHREQGRLYDFSDHEYAVITSLLEKTNVPKGHYQFIPAIREPNTLADDLKTADYNTHRPFLFTDLKSPAV